MEKSPINPESIPKNKSARKYGASVLSAAALAGIGTGLKLASMPTTAFGKEITPHITTQDGIAGNQDRHEVGGGVLSYKSRGGHAETVQNPIIDHGEMGAIDANALVINTADQGHGDPSDMPALSTKKPPARGGHATPPTSSWHIAEHF